MPPRSSKMKAGTTHREELVSGWLHLILRRNAQKFLTYDEVDAVEVIRQVQLLGSIRLRVLLPPRHGSETNFAYDQVARAELPVAARAMAAATKKNQTTQHLLDLYIMYIRYFFNDAKYKRHSTERWQGTESGISVLQLHLLANTRQHLAVLVIVCVWGVQQE